MMYIGLNQLINFENKYNLKERKILNIKYWDFCRMSTFYIIKAKCNNTDLVVDLLKTTTLRERKLSFKFVFKYFLYNKKNIDLLFVSDPRRTKQENFFEAHFVDSITHYLEKDYTLLTIEEPNWRAWGYGMPSHFSPTNSVDLKYVDVYEHIFLLKKQLFKTFKKKQINIINEELNYLFFIIEKEFHIDISSYKPFFLDFIIYFIVMKKTYLKVLKKINPKLVLLNYRPTYFKILINSICRANNIKTVDLQHGVIAKEDPLDRKDPTGQNLLSTSDYLFAYGEKLVNKTNLCFSNETIKYVGYPFLERKAKEKLKCPPMLNNDYKYILIISQSIAGQQFAKLAEELSILLQDRVEYKIIFKYHPNEIYKTFKELERDNIIQIKNMDYEIYQFQKYSYCQIGAYSTGLYEGLKFYTPTFILMNFPGADGTIEILNFMQKGIYKVTNAKEIVDILDDIQSPLASDVNLLWKENSLENIKTEIEKILKNYKNQ